MNAGFLYILKNHAFGPSVIKIGCTKKSPNLRAQEIYAGSTGVPMPFHAAAAYQVADHKDAEKIVHRKLKAYRLNNRREFFRIPLDIAMNVAKAACDEINAKLQFTDATEMRFDAEQLDFKISPENHKRQQKSSGHMLIKVPIDAIQESPIGTSTLTKDQIERIEIISIVFKDAFPDPPEKWCSDFSRDENPEPEIYVWEHIAKAYLSFDHDYLCTLEQKEEAFNLLLARSYRSTNEVLSEYKPTHFSMQSAKRLLNFYELRPKPIGLRANPSFSLAAA